MASGVTLALALLVFLGAVAVACGDGEVSPGDAPAGPAATSDTTSTQAPPTESPSPAANPVLRSDGLGAVPFGEPADAALALLADVLGRQPTEDSTYDAMAHGFGGTTVRFVGFGPLTVIFSDGGYYRDDGVLYFAGWTLSGPDSSALATPQGITIGSTVDDLRSAFGDQLRLSTEPSECTGTWVFGVGPSELGFEGELSGPSTDGSSSVTSLSAGAQSSC
jgi:hypothetical protein